MSQETQVPKETVKVVQYTKPERWFKFFGMFIAGMLSLFGYQKMPIVNESTKISEAVQVVKSLPPEQITALQAVQMTTLEKQVIENREAQLQAISELKSEIKSILRDYDDRTQKRLDKHGELILNNIKAIARLEAVVPKARAQTQ